MIGRGGPATAGTNGFLFCDLRGYAAYVDARGDRAAAELLRAYRALVRDVVAAHAGAEIRTEGDSVYVVFPTASAAVEAAVEIVDSAAAGSTPELPIRVGIGVHAGETIASDEGPVGEAVNIAARVCAKAQAGEVLVTDTVRSIARTLLPYRFVGLGRQSLKGIGGIALYRVEAVSAGRMAHLRRRVVARQRLVGGVAALVVVAILAATAAWVVTKPADCLTLGPETQDVVARIDPGRGCVVATYAVGQRPGPIVSADSGVWVGNTDSWTVSRIDPATGHQQVVSAGGRPLSMSATPDGDLIALSRDDRSGTSSKLSSRMWLVHITAVDTRVFTAYELPIFMPTVEHHPDYSNLAVSGLARVATWGDRVVMTNRATGQLGVCGFAGTGLCSSGVDKITLKEPARPNPIGNKFAAGTEAIAVAGGAAWVGDLTEPVLYRYDVKGCTSLGLGGSVGTAEIAATETTLWLLRTDGSLTAFSVKTNTGPTFEIEGKPTRVAVTDSSVWVGDTAENVVRHVSTENGKTLTTVPIGGEPAGIAIGPDGSLWVAVAGR